MSPDPYYWDDTTDAKLEDVVTRYEAFGEPIILAPVWHPLPPVDRTAEIDAYCAGWATAERLEVACIRVLVWAALVLLVLAVVLGLVHAFGVAIGLTIPHIHGITQRWEGKP